MTYIIPTLIATGSISVIALLCAGLLNLFPKWLNRVVPGLVALSGGTMLSASFLHLLPESLELLPAKTALSLALASFVAFLLIERVFRWHHCHGQHDHSDSHRSVGYMNLLGDSFHNFIDGLVIAGAFYADPILGISTTIAVAMHEIPQEIGDFGVLIHSGFSRTSALLANFAIALMVVAGALFGILLLQYITTLSMYLLPIAAGSFLYIATVDLIPEIHKRLRGWETFGLVFMFLFGLMITPTTELALRQLGVVEEHTHAEGEVHEDEHGLHDEHDEHEEAHADEHDEDHHDETEHEEEL